MLDATRESDGEMVMLRRISSINHPNEQQIHEYLLEQNLDIDTSGRKHIVPIHQVLQVPDSPESIVVLPYLRPSSDPPFLTVEEAVEFFKQIFKVPFLKPDVKMYF